MTMEALRQVVEVMFADWQLKLPSDVHVTLGGSVASDTVVMEGASYVDVDIRFLVDNPDVPGLTDAIASVTGLKFSRTISVADWPSGRSQAHIIEQVVCVPCIPLPARLQGCVRNRNYVGWHKLYQAVFTPNELAAFRAEKRHLQGDPIAYMTCKKAMLAKCKERAVAMGLVQTSRATSATST